MATFKQVRDVLERVQAIHKACRRYYEAKAEESPDERLRGVFERLGRQQRRLEEALARYDDGEQKAVLDTWLQYVPEPELWESVEKAEIDPEMPAEEAMSRALELDRTLHELYRSLAGATSAPRVRELFQSLAEQSEGEMEDHAFGVVAEEQDGPR